MRLSISDPPFVSECRGAVKIFPAQTSATLGCPQKKPREPTRATRSYRAALPTYILGFRLLHDSVALPSRC